jgi:hypothetical protein
MFHLVDFNNDDIHDIIKKRRQGGVFAVGAAY